MFVLVPLSSKPNSREGGSCWLLLLFKTFFQNRLRRADLSLYKKLTLNIPIKKRTEHKSAQSRLVCSMLTNIFHPGRWSFSILKQASLSQRPQSGLPYTHTKYSGCWFINLSAVHIWWEPPAYQKPQHTLHRHGDRAIFELSTFNFLLCNQWSLNKFMYYKGHNVATFFKIWGKWSWGSIQLCPWAYTSGLRQPRVVVNVP